ncbi:hypothetical protein CkaCkLH20_11538 [Colletotrichum karsti]|uniref:Apple domain-containing protein n=1 Tax=Colletotrichum karsti TaxID=1095194 RepID=A0A9P6HXJ3_9PEZI|nr:uncharacterized protein CkaCkLH20_11538 [Colletotrichum karsti]KAF9870866.1 hypothetical protein CkaCkLH20_11538 [Colletotrichum karsti]
MRTLPVFAAFLATGTAQLFNTFDLQQIPASTIQTVPVGVGNQTIAPSKRDVRSNLVVRDCSPLPPGSGPVPSIDTDQAFLADPDFSNAANAALTPSGWYQTFKNLQAATSASAYQGYNTYATYDPARCASECMKMSGCSAFNIFFERDPSLDPASRCPNPPSTTVIKCSFWGVGIGPSTATNNGQTRNDFHVVIAGSNGYQLTAPEYPVAGYTSTFTDAATINAPSTCNSYITYKAHTDGAYDPSLCAADCASQKQETNPFNGLTCHFFTSYLLLKNGVTQAQICALYSRTWDKTYATNTGYTSGSDIYSIQYAYAYSYTNDPGTPTCPQGSSGPSSSTTASYSGGILSTTVAASGVGTANTATSKATTLSTSVKPVSTSTSSMGGSSAASFLTSCPNPLSYIVGYSGGLYAVCVDTDFQISSPQIFYGYQSNRDCVTQCEKTSGCTKAVFRPSTQTCYLKGSPGIPASNWAVNSGFQTLVKVADGTSLTQCLAPTYTIPFGRTTYTVCPGSDFTNNPATDIWYGVWSEAACVVFCRLRPGCAKVVYNSATQTCYNKGNPSLASAGWHVNTQFRAIYIS